MITNEIYKDRITQNEEQQTKHLKYLVGVLNEYLIVYTKASHSKTYAVKMNALMDSYSKTKDLNVGLTICMELLKYDPSDKEKQTNIHIVISRIVYNAIKEIEYNNITDFQERVYNILMKVEENYRVQYRDCYSRLAHTYKDNRDYTKAIELYTILTSIENDKPVSNVVEASYLLTHCYVELNKDNMSDYDIASTKDILEDYSSHGGVDYYDVKGTVENLENNRASGGYHLSDTSLQNYDSLN